MKKNIPVMVLLFLSSVLLATAQAGQIPLRSLRNNIRSNNSQDGSSGSSQRKPLLPWRNQTSQDVPDSQQTFSNRLINLPLTGDEASLQWVREQIDTVLTKLQDQGVSLPGDMDQKLNNFFSTARDYLAQTQKDGSLPFSNLLKGPGYNLTCNYDPKTRIMDFVANRVLSSDNSLTSIDLSGSFDPAGPWDMAFNIVNSISNRDKDNTRKSFFQRVSSSMNPSSMNPSSVATSSQDISSASQADNSKNPQQPDDNSTQPAHASGFIFSGEICQDGLISLYLNPFQTVNLYRAGNSSYATRTGIEIVQNAGSREGKFYIDVLDNSVSGADSNVLYHWETPLW